MTGIDAHIHHLEYLHTFATLSLNLLINIMEIIIVLVEF